MTDRTPDAGAVQETGGGVSGGGCGDQGSLHEGVRDRLPAPEWAEVARADTAKALAEFKGQLPFLNGLTRLDADTAKALAAIDNWNGYLPSIVAIESPDSVEIAAALAKRKGPLSLPNLKKLSPRTLQVADQEEGCRDPADRDTGVDSGAGRQPDRKVRDPRRGRAVSAAEGTAAG